MHKTKFLKKAFMISRIVGMCPLSFNDGLPRIDYFILPYSIIIMSFLCFLIFQLLIDPPYKGNWISLMTVLTQNLLLCFNVVSSYLGLALTRNTLRSVFMFFLDAEIYFARLGKKPSHEISLFYDLILLLLGSILFLRNSPKSIYSIVKLSQAHYLLLSVFVSIQPFIKLASLIKSRFRLLNSTFMELSSYQFCQREVIEIILKLHDTLCRASEDLNKCFSFQLLFTSFLGFTNFTINAYLTITAKNNSVLIITALRTFILGFNLLRMALLANVCKTAADESKQLHVLLHQRLLDEDIRNIKNMGKVETYLLMKRSVEFKGFGFLIIDHTLLLSMLGAGTTYLVVLLQAGNSEVTNLPPTNATIAANNN